MYVLYTKQPPNVRVITIATVELSFNASDICLIISDEGVVLLSFISNESVLICDIYVMMCILLFEKMED